MTEIQTATMRRNMDLVRRILLVAEASHPGEVKTADFVDQDTNEATVAYHFQLMGEAGLIEASLITLERFGAVKGTVERLRWAGHEFLEAVRNETVWAQTKETTRKAGGSLTFEVMKAVAVKLLSTAVGLS
jgi:hypothetical protein